MAEIIPAIIAQTHAELEQKFWAIRSVAKTVQVDVGDGEFVASKTWPYTDGAARDLHQFAGEIEIETHLMISAPERTIREWVASGARRIIVHQEATDELGLVADVVRDAGHELGIALKLETPIRVLDAWMEHVRVIQLMGIAEIGFYGHEFDDAVLPKIEAVRLKYPKSIIEVDGGVTLANAPKLSEMGVDRLVVGSAIFKAADPVAAYQQFVDAVKK